MRNSLLPVLLRAIRRRHLLLLLFPLLLFTSFLLTSVPFPSSLKGNLILIPQLRSSLSITHSTLLTISPLFTPHRTCQSHLLLSSHRLRSAQISLNPDPKLLDARAYLSAALHYQYDCFNYLSNLNKSTVVHPSLFSAIVGLSNLTSDSLSVLNSYIRFGSGSSPFQPPVTERQGYFESPTVLTPKKILEFSLLPKTTRPNATVCKKTGSCDYTSIQSAISAAPNYSSTHFIIHIKAGIYKEIVRVAFEKTNIVIIGAGRGKTVISGELNAQMPNLTTIDTATFSAVGDGFRAFNLTFQNSAGFGAHQAVAFRSDSDKSVLHCVEFKGHQDTLYARSMRQLYHSCYITGTIDFIFGNAAAIFQNCTIEAVPRLENPQKGAKNVITAQGRINPNQATGFVFNNCTINGNKEYLEYYAKRPAVNRVYLGRPWKEYSRVIVIACNLGEVVRKEGWLAWRGDFALNTLFFGESDNWGPGGEMKWRVQWSSEVPKERENVYSVENFIQGHEWIGF
ncbi:hypothetical protein LUZ60_004565 [Juncus effusus]|nr:hypothetical protein LUZ60_004565 [Juncus effusus]